MVQTTSCIEKRLLIRSLTSPVSDLSTMETVTTESVLAMAQGDGSFFHCSGARHLENGLCLRRAVRHTRICLESCPWRLQIFDDQKRARRLDARRRQEYFVYKQQWQLISNEQLGTGTKCGSRSNRTTRTPTAVRLLIGKLGTCLSLSGNDAAPNDLRQTSVNAQKRRDRNRRRVPTGTVRPSRSGAVLPCKCEACSPTT